MSLTSCEKVIVRVKWTLLLDYTINSLLGVPCLVHGQHAKASLVISLSHCSSWLIEIKLLRGTVHDAQFCQKCLVNQIKQFLLTFFASILSINKGFKLVTIIAREDLLSSLGHILNILMAGNAITPMSPDQFSASFDEALLLLDIFICSKLVLDIEEIFSALTWHLQGAVARCDLWRFCF